MLNVVTVVQTFFPCFFLFQKNWKSDSSILWICFEEHNGNEGWADFQIWYRFHFKIWSIFEICCFFAALNRFGFLDHQFASFILSPKHGQSILSFTPTDSLRFFPFLALFAQKLSDFKVVWFKTLDKRNCIVIAIFRLLTRNPSQFQSRDI